MGDRKKFEESITKQSKIKNFRGYVSSISENLIENLTVDLFEEDLMNGSGNELKSKFEALYSSSALAVNNFALVKKHLSKFSFEGFNHFTSASFERQFKTGLSGTPPNLDFVLENSEITIGFESKYLELINQKKAEFAESYNSKNLSYLDPFWFSLIENYKNKCFHLDVAQLIKHAIGLIKHKRNNKKRIMLVYIYWVPANSAIFDLYEKHEKELFNFANNLKDQNMIEFKYMTYVKLWDYFETESTFRNHSINLRNRYFINI